LKATAAGVPCDVVSIRRQHHRPPGERTRGGGRPARPAWRTQAGAGLWWLAETRGDPGRDAPDDAQTFWWRTNWWPNASPQTASRRAREQRW